MDDSTNHENNAPPRAPTHQYSFARFWRCALQVNPANYSSTYRGQDHGHEEDAYNQALLEQCRKHSIEVVGIADHGSVDRVDKLRGVLAAGGIVVFPGFEIASTEKIHMVCLFHEETTITQLNRYLGALQLMDPQDGVRPSSLGCVGLAKKVEELGGFWYAAHATGANGILRLNKDGGGLTHVWTSRCVRVVQLPMKPEQFNDKAYRDILTNRDANYKRDRLPAYIRAKDVAKPEDLGDPAAFCLVKMTKPTFEAFKIAFLDPESRVRFEPEEGPRAALASMRIRSGYLDGVDAHFSDHLNAIIGGRGTGKSTLIECLRYALELSPKGKQALKLHQDIVKENLGRSSGSVELTVRSAAQHGRAFTVSRRYGEPPIVRDDKGVVSQQSPRDLLPQIEIYGQNEIFELAQDGASRARLLERFLPSGQFDIERHSTLRKKLADNSQRLVKVRIELDELTERVGRLPKLGEQLKGFQELGIEEKLARTPLYARERQLVQRIENETARLADSVKSLTEGLPDLAFLSDKALDGLPDAALLSSVRSELERLCAEVAKQTAALSTTVKSGGVALAPHLAAWAAAMAEGERELEGALAGLPNMAGKTGREVGVAYREVTQEIERTRPLEAKKDSLAKLLTSLEQERQSLVAELSDLRQARAGALQSAVATLNRRLKGKLRVDLRVEGARDALKAFLLGCKLENVGEKRLSWIEEKEATPRGLADAIRRRATADAFELTPGVSEALEKLSFEKLLELEALELADDVTIELNVAHGDAENYRDLSRLSTGQQCTAVLHLLLLDNPDPLVVDQPEDNLDNAFIAERIVRELRDAKTHRQFLFSTHNANIPVFGDAEWIGVLTVSENVGVLGAEHQGSIDVPFIREQAAAILEGGRAAFTQRKEMYEF